MPEVAAAVTFDLRKNSQETGLQEVGLGGRRVVDRRHVGFLGGEVGLLEAGSKSSSPLGLPARAGRPGSRSPIRDIV